MMGDRSPVYSLNMQPATWSVLSLLHSATGENSRLEL